METNKKIQNTIKKKESRRPKEKISERAKKNN